jgi:hypothetical protein
MFGGTLMSTFWLALLKAQRPLRYAEITGELAEIPKNRISTALNLAFRLGYIERHGEPKRYSYAVTPRCNIPPGVQVLEILEATA